MTLIPTGSTVPATATWLNSDPVTDNLETTTAQGYRIDAPWFGGSRASNKSIVRLSNSGATATGSVTMSLANATLASGESLTKTSCSFPSVASGSELVFDEAASVACFGNFVRGDLSITVLGNVSALTAKMRVLSVNGSVSEQTLGNITASSVVLQ